MGTTFTVPKISNGPATAATFNAPLEYIQTALNTLQQNLQATNGASATIQWQVPVAANVSAGDLVYYNTDSSRYEKALAKLSSRVGAQGQAIQEESCKVQGIVLSKDSTDNSAALIRCGYYVSNVVLAAIGVGAQAGTYYLSAKTAGKAVLGDAEQQSDADPGWDIRIPCIRYYGDGKFSVLPSTRSYIGQGESVVRSINSTSLRVTTRDGGAVTIEKPVRTTGAPDLSAYAVSSFSDSTVSLTSIVSWLQSGAGVKCTYKGRGVWSVALDSLINKPLAATDFTLNGAQRITDTLLTYTVFPSGSQASVVMSMPVDFISQTAFQGAIRLWATTRGPGLGNISATVYWIPYSSTPVTIANCQIGTATLTASNNSTTQLKYSESADISNVQIGTSGILVAKLSVSSPTYDIYLHQAGFKLALTEDSDSSSTASSITEQEVIDILERYLVFNPNYSA